ncbi:uncharacterized protein LOC133378790 [Rhineura floridana]|uniref:uncharacterized protein LOC133378790 n=1 Tax=Rhineura floridana TaxID=261503 RepID=UPI002AC8627D|nr:uncharacterized protein LOC133378790 [Rhineura floridana]
MNFVTDLPSSQGKITVLVVVDTFTKMVHFIPCTGLPNAQDTACLYVQHVYQLHGLQDVLVFDRGAQFMARFWQAMWQILQSELRLSSSHHPQMDGQTERVNAMLEEYLHCYVNYQQDNWVSFLPLVEFIYNNAVHSTTQQTPFFANLGYHPQAFAAPRASPFVLAAEDFVQELQAIQHLLREQLEWTKEDYKKAADQHQQEGAEPGPSPAPPALLKPLQPWAGRPEARVRARRPEPPWDGEEEAPRGRLPGDAVHKGAAGAGPARLSPAGLAGARVRLACLQGWQSHSCCPPGRSLPATSGGDPGGGGRSALQEAVEWRKGPGRDRWALGVAPPRQSPRRVFLQVPRPSSTSPLFPGLRQASLTGLPPGWIRPLFSTCTRRSAKPWTGGARAQPNVTNGSAPNEDLLFALRHERLAPSPAPPLETKGEAWRCYTSVCVVRERTSEEWELIQSVPGVWAENNPSSLAVRAEPVRITLKPQASPIQLKQYPIPSEAREPIQHHLNRLMELGVLTSITSAWNTPLLPVKKPGTEGDYRPVQDLRAVNESVISMTPIVPNPYTLLGRIPGGSTIYTVIDLKDAFFSIPLAEEAIPLFAFTWEDVQTGVTSQYSWTQLPQGFCHSPSIFSQQLNKDLISWQEENGPLLIYVDDILLPSPDFDTCWKYSKSLLQTLEALGYRASQKKAQICQLEVEYLGFIIQKDQRYLSPARTAAIRSLPRPETKKELRTLLGMAGYCRIWILDYATITKPLYSMLQEWRPETAPLDWEPSHVASLEKLNNALLNPPALGIPDTTRPFKLFVDDRRGVAVGMLTQALGSWERPVAYLSKKLDPVSQGWPSCLRSIAATSLLLTEALKLTFGQTIQVTASNSIRNLLEKQGPKWMTSSRLIKYTAQLCENPNVIVQDRATLNPATLMPVPEQEPVHDCEEIMTKVFSSRPDLKDQPLRKGRSLFCDGSSYLQQGTKVAGYAVVEQGGHIVRHGKLPPGTSAHKAEIIALTEALREGAGQEVTIYTDSKNAFLTLQVHGALYKERGFLTSEGRPIAYAHEIRALLDAVWKPRKVAVVHCRAHKRQDGPVEGQTPWIHWTRVKSAANPEWEVVTNTPGALRMRIRKRATTGSRDMTGEASSGPATE